MPRRRRRPALADGAAAGHLAPVAPERTPLGRRGTASISTIRPAKSGQPWAVYLPYLAYGGQIWLNGAQVAQLPENTEGLHVRWIRPHFAPLPDTLLHPGSNRLMVRAALPPPGPSMNMPRLGIGPEAELRPLYDRRFFWLSITPYITAVICLLVAAFVLFIWWRRRSEVLYGLFGLAAGCGAFAR